MCALGVTAGNVDEMSKSTTPAIQRLLGASGDLGSRLGQRANISSQPGNSAKWVRHAVS